MRRTTRVMVRLVVSAGPDRGRTLLLLRGGRYSVGKAPDCDLVLTDSAVSRRHLVLKVLPDGVGVLDVGSKNGSFFQGARFRELILGVGAVLSIGASQLVMADAELGLSGRDAADPATALDWAEGSDFHGTKRQIIASWEKAFLLDLMQRAGGNVARAAKQAGIDRPYLYRLLRKHGLGPAEGEP